jgi:hypothetical protein
MKICYGWARKPMNLSSNQRYHPEQLMARLTSFNSGIDNGIKHGINEEINDNRAKTGKSKSASKSTKGIKPLASPLVWMPIWVCMENNFVRLNTKDEMELACKLVCIHHNGYHVGTDEKQLYCPEDDWQYISEKEASLAGLRCDACDSDTDDG